MTDQYVNIQGWMRDDLGLTGNRLFAYAIVWGFSQDGESLYRGGYRYLSSWVGCGINTIRSLMSSLVDDGLIIKEEELLEGKTRVNFRVNVERAKEQRGLQKLEGMPPKIGGVLYIRKGIKKWNIKREYHAPSVSRSLYRQLFRK